MVRFGQWPLIWWVSSPSVIRMEALCRRVSQEIRELQGEISEVVGFQYELPFTADWVHRYSTGFLFQDDSSAVIPKWLYIGVDSLGWILQWIPRGWKFRYLAKRLHINLSNLVDFRNGLKEILKHAKAMKDNQYRRFHYFKQDRKGNLFVFGSQVSTTSSGQKYLDRIGCGIVSPTHAGYGFQEMTLKMSEAKYIGGHIGRCYFVYDIVFRGGHPNTGSGTDLIKILIQHARESGIRRIEGNISWVDYGDHPERLERFYRKNGFQFYWGPNRYGGHSGKVWVDLETVCGPTRPVTDSQGEICYEGTPDFLPPYSKS